MKKILLVYIKGAEIGTRTNQSYPLGLMTIQSFALQEKDIIDNITIEIKELDYDFHDEAFVFDIKKNNYVMVLFSSYIWNISRSLEIGRKIKLVLPKLIIGLGGPEVDDSIQLMEENKFLDLIMVGEGEITFKSLIKYYLLNDKNTQLTGLVYRGREGLIDKNNPVLIENLDEIPSIVDSPLVLKSNVLLYETSRGCPFQCKYCCWADKKMRYYSLERVEKDIKTLLSLKNGEQFFLIDSELDIDLNRAKEIMKYIIRYNVNKKTVQGFLGLHTLDEELLSLCQKAGFKFGIGIQTISEKALKISGRSWFDPQNFEKKVKLLKKYFKLEDIEFQLIMGLPGDDFNSFRNSLKWCDNLGAKNIAANRLYVLPGSYFYRHAEEYGIVFDKKPFHLVYSNNTYSYEDIMKSETLLVAFQITKSVFGNRSVFVFNNRKLELWDFIDSFSEVLSKNSLYPQGRQESQIVEKNRNYEKYMLQSMENIKYNQLEFINVVKMFMVKKNAYYYFLKNLKQIKNEGNEKGNIIKINNYFISVYVQLEGEYKEVITKTGESHIVYLMNYKTLMMKSIIVNNHYIMETIELLEILKQGIEKIHISNYIKNSYQKKFLYNLLDSNMVFTT